MLDKKGRLFGKISIIDLAVILIIIMAVVGIGYNMIYANTNKTAPGVKSLFYNNAEASDVEALVYVEPVREMTVNAISVGDKLYDETTKTYIGEVAEVVSEPATEDLIMVDGSIIKAELPERYRVKLKVKIAAVNRDGDYYTQSNIAIVRNGTLAFYTEKISTSGKIQSITDLGVTE